MMPQRNFTLRVRLTAEDIKQIRAEANRLGQTLSEYVRRRVKGERNPS